MSEDFYEWIKDTFDGKYVPHSGEARNYDYNYREMSRLLWTNGVISEVGFPALDGSSKDPAYMTVKIAPQEAKYERTMESGLPSPILPPANVQKKWLAANFRLQLPGCQADCRVNKIDALIFTFANRAQSTGGAVAQVKPTIPNLVITLPMAHAQELYRWREESANQNNAQASEKAGTLDYFSADLKPLFTLTFGGINVLTLAPEKREIPRLKATMSCTKVRFAYYTA
jgi:hypothetical protein